MGEVKTDLALLLPKEVEGWRVTAKDQRYNRTTLYQYIDGGAELYLSYGFNEAINRTYSKPNQPAMVVDIFDMGISQNAFGVFSHSREVVEESFGQGSQYTEGLLLFWKDRYYISLLAHPETVESKKAVFTLARNIDKAIKEKGPLPEMLSLLPKKSLVEESIRYFRHHAWLNSHYFVADQNILHINENTDALLAKYGKKDEQSILLLVNYKSDGDAQRAYDDFVKQYLPELSKKPAVKIEDGRWTSCQLQGNLLIVVFNAPGEDNARNLIEEVKELKKREGGKATR
jgi:hypothetical protein